IPDNDRRSYSRSCARFQAPCKVPPSPRRLAGEPQTAVFHPLPNTPSKASLPPLYGEKCHLCVRYNVLPMSQAAHLEIQSVGETTSAVLLASLAFLGTLGNTCSSSRFTASR